MPSDPQNLLFRNGETATKPRTVVFLGEFSSGKSTLINSLIGHPVLRTRVTATQVPTVELRYGNASDNVALDYHGVVSPIGDRDPFSLHYDDYVLIRLHDRFPILRKLSLIDTPGISDPRLPMNVLKACADSADLAVWCTHATQAWRESERATWQNMPERLRANSILVVTRSDQLSPDDRTRLAQRLAVETRGLFGAVVVASVPVIADLIRSEDTVSTDWIVSGGAGLFAALNVAPEDLRSTAEQSIDWHALLAEQDPAIRRADLEALAEHFAAVCADLIDRTPDALQAIRSVEQRIWEDTEIEAARAALGEGDVKTLTRIVSTVANAVLRRSDRRPGAAGEDSLDETEARGAGEPELASSSELALQPGQSRSVSAENFGEPGERQHELVNNVDNTIDAHPEIGAFNSLKRRALARDKFMTTDISALREISGFVGACLVDSESGLLIGSEGGGTLDLEMAAAGNTDFLRSKQKVIADLGLNERIEDILITLSTQIHLIRPLEKSPTVFLYLALDKASSNLGLARIKLRKIESTLEI